MVCGRELAVLTQAVQRAMSDDPVAHRPILDALVKAGIKEIADYGFDMQNDCHALVGQILNGHILPNGTYAAGDTAPQLTSEEVVQARHAKEVIDAQLLPESLPVLRANMASFQQRFSLEGQRTPQERMLFGDATLSLGDSGQILDAADTTAQFSADVSHFPVTVSGQNAGLFAGYFRGLGFPVVMAGDDAAAYRRTDSALKASTVAFPSKLRPSLTSYSAPQFESFQDVVGGDAALAGQDSTVVGDGQDVATSSPVPHDPQSQSDGVVPQPPLSVVDVNASS